MTSCVGFRELGPPAVPISTARSKRSGVLDEQVEGERAAERVADETRLLDPEGVEHSDHLADPHPPPVAHVRRRRIGVRAVAVADEVRREALEAVAQRRQRELPVRPSGRARPSAVEEHDARLVPLTGPVDHDVEVVDAGDLMNGFDSCETSGRDAHHPSLPFRASPHRPR